jgi:hypothetical protein
MLKGPSVYGIQLTDMVTATSYEKMEAMTGR